MEAVDVKRNSDDTKCDHGYVATTEWRVEEFIAAYVSTFVSANGTFTESLDAADKAAQRKLCQYSLRPENLFNALPTSLQRDDSQHTWFLQHYWFDE